MSCFLASCDDEDKVTFDYNYDSVATLPAPELELEKARQIQASGKLENVEVTDAVVPTAELDESIDGGSDIMSVDDGMSDPNFN
ncbi:MAG: hypothetical protein JW745_02030 [Sedimentisphaerales bacterium]|nr:hypothetical protein [Sedimentisphaerales bacterium]MBN2842999.1 hypothetical protein [Sedimentisphaerales bacterium]